MDAENLILLEARALEVVLRVSQDKGLIPEAIALTQEALNHQRPPLTIADHTTQGAMRLIVGHPIEVPTFQPTTKPKHCHIFEVTAKSWLLWASKSNPEESLQNLQRLRITLGRKALQTMVLRPWRDAVEALFKGETSEALMLFHRASEISAQLGTRYTPTIQWTLAASSYSLF
jgi:hypothetical protein